MAKGFKIDLCAFSTAASAAVEYVVLDNSIQPPDVVETSPGVEFIAKGADGVLLDAAEDFSVETLTENSLEGVSYDIYHDDESLKLSGTGNMVPVSLADGAGNVYLRNVFAAGAPGNVIAEDGGFIELGGGIVPDVPEFKGAWTEPFATNGAGRIYLAPGDYTFAIGADDEAHFTMGGMTSRIDGSHALEWGDPASFSVLQAGVYEYSWDYINCVLNVAIRWRVLFIDDAINGPWSEEAKREWKNKAKERIESYYSTVQYKCYRQDSQGNDACCPNGVSVSVRVLIDDNVSNEDAMTVSVKNDSRNRSSVNRIRNTANLDVADVNEQRHGEQRQVPIVHESGHMLGLHHPGGVGNAATNYNADPELLMGKGMILRLSDFNSAFCAHISETEHWGGR